MKKRMFNILSLCATLAVIIAAASNMAASHYIFHQPPVPEKVRKLS